MANRPKRSGLTLLEMMIIVAVIAVLLAVLVPAIQSGQRAGRRTVCLNNLKQWSMGTLNHEAGLMELPMGVGFKHRGNVVPAQPLSGFVTLLPYMECCNVSPLEGFNRPTVINGVKYPAYGVPLSQPNYRLWEFEIDGLVCPSAKPSTSKFGRTSYAFSLGDVARNVNQQETLRGAFGYYKANRFGAFTDGISNTIGIIEIGGGKTETFRGGCWMDGKAAWLDDPSQVLSLIKNGKYPTSAKMVGRGSHWADGRAGVGLANTILPPNSPSFQVQGSPTDDGIYSAGSMHAGGVNVAFMDGSTHFISDDIDAGKLSTPTLTKEQMEAEDGTVSPHGVWGALGTIGSGDRVDLLQL